MDGETAGQRMHVVRIANFVSPTSGGIKTALSHWGQGYRARGHRVSLIIPGPGPQHTQEAQGAVYRLPAVPMGRSGYSLIVARKAMQRVLTQLRPDVVEVSDRVTTRWVGDWARQRGVGSVMISHENVTGIMDRRTPLPAGAGRWLADRLNHSSANDYDQVVCPSEYAASEFRRLGVDAAVVPLGVDLAVFAPAPPGRALAPDARAAEPGVLQLIHCGRLSPEKNPGLSIATLRELRRRGVDAQLTVLGHGPMRERLMDEAADDPVVFHSYIRDRATLAAAMGRADVALAPGPVETFGLAALEALACGIPTVCPDEGALREVVGDAGIAAPSTAAAFADAVLTLHGRGQPARSDARAQAQQFSWDRSTDRMLGVLRAATGL